MAAGTPILFISFIAMSLYCAMYCAAVISCALARKNHPLPKIKMTNILFIKKQELKNSKQRDLFFYDHHQSIPYSNYCLLHSFIPCHMFVKSVDGFCIFSFDIFVQHCSMKQHVISKYDASFS